MKYLKLKVDIKLYYSKLYLIVIVGKGFDIFKYLVYNVIHVDTKYCISLHFEETMICYVLHVLILQKKILSLLRQQ
jgi:hypothetical protein